MILILPSVLGSSNHLNQRIHWVLITWQINIIRYVQANYKKISLAHELTEGFVASNK